MGCRLLCCVALCLLRAGSLDTAVSQDPKYLVTQVGNKKSLNCKQNLGHNAMYWYKQDSKQLLKLMFIYYNKELNLNETVPSRFSPEAPDKAHLNLHVKFPELEDSAMYLCASSQDTALQIHCLPVHKPPGQPGSGGGLVFTHACAPSPWDQNECSSYGPAFLFTKWRNSSLINANTANLNRNQGLGCMVTKVAVEPIKSVAFFLVKLPRLCLTYGMWAAEGEISEGSQRMSVRSCKWQSSISASQNLRPISNQPSYPLTESTDKRTSVIPDTWLG
ncbi:PREDICTED: uncharacterized protein LOC105989482 [Dipodomys ordii]|uniref:Uncharacterized protein LOC105989482 n=1 Tax=Dipodomys ordii TaxID=10020 RepID=A0A1S3FKC2_DIPOR|nr:PREDICTED: uncharacterized protein LOC105989482 [Dipodomys ordii]